MPGENNNVSHPLGGFEYSSIGGNDFVYSKSLQASLQAQIKSVKEAQKKNSTSSKEVDDLEKHLKRLSNTLKALNESGSKQTEEYEQLASQMNSYAKKLAEAQLKQLKIEEDYTNKKKKLDSESEELTKKTVDSLRARIEGGEGTKELEEFFKKYAEKLSEAGRDSEAVLAKLSAEKARRNSLTDRQRRQEDNQAIIDSPASTSAEYNRASLENWGLSFLDKIEEPFKDLNTSIQTVGKAAVALGNAIDSKMDGIIVDRAHLGTRLIGAMEGMGEVFYDYTESVDNLFNNIVVKGLVKQSDVMEKMREAADRGVAFNTEERALLQALAEDIATTFDAFDDSLTRIVKLQQADSTNARLGMESFLTRFLNSSFMDSSYMNGMRKNVTSSLTDASSLMSYADSAEFEFAAQKWFGSLYSVGMSDSSISALADALNALATGDVSKLSGNQSMQTLFATAANNAGLDYADMILNGLNASDVNRLMKSVVEYLQEVVENTDSNAVMSAWKDIYGISISDLSAIRNLSSGDISNIYGTSMTYNSMQSEVSNQISTIGKKIGLSGVIDNLVENTLYGVTQNIVSNPAMMMLWQAAGLTESVTGGIHLPNIEIMGNAVDLSQFTIEQLVKTGVAGLGVIGEVMETMRGIPDALNGTLGVISGGTKTVKHGGGTSTSSGGINYSTTSSTYVSNTSSDDISKSSVAEKSEDTEQQKQMSSDLSNENKTTNDIYSALFEENKIVTVNLPDTFKSTTDLFNQSIENTDRLMLALAFGEMFSNLDTEPLPVAITSIGDLSEKISKCIDEISSGNQVIKVNVDSFSDNAEFKAMTLNTLNMEDYINNTVVASIVNGLMDRLFDSNSKDKSLSSVTKAASAINSGSLTVSLDSGTMMKPIYVKETMI